MAAGLSIRPYSGMSSQDFTQTVAPGGSLVLNRQTLAGDSSEATQEYIAKKALDQTEIVSSRGPLDVPRDQSNPNPSPPSSPAMAAGRTVAPFLARHVPGQYAPWGNQKQVSNSNTRYCYRHHPDLKCKRQADEPSMDQLQHVRGCPGSRLLRFKSNLIAVL